jgi:hypothetical protein
MKFVEGQGMGETCNRYRSLTANLARARIEPVNRLCQNTKQSEKKNEKSAKLKITRTYALQFCLFVYRYYVQKRVIKKKNENEAKGMCA